jgi:processive 1,2-diacylglycerol beta-glucosyltransferase
MLNILSLISGYDGCGFYRVQTPGKYLNKCDDIHYKITTEYNLQNIEWADLIVLQKQSNPKAIPFIEHALSRGKKIVTEVDDDYFNIPTWNPAHKHYQDKADDVSIFYKKSHALTVTTEHLAHQLSTFNQNSFVIPNYIDFNYIDKVSKNPNKSRNIKFLDKTNNVLDKDYCFKLMNERFTIGWGGSPTHLKDLEQATDALIKICQENKNILVVMMACTTDRIIKEIPSDQLLLIAPVPIFLYYDILSSIKLDLAICPIEDNIFNRSKSNLKFLEFSSFGFPCVASNVENYAKTIVNKETGILVDNTDSSWFDGLKNMVEDADLRLQIKKNAISFVRDNYDIASNYMKWYDAYTSLIKV